jgi:lysyl-tRNA synthetase class 1
MTEQNIIGKGTWIDKLASELIEREKQLGRDIDGTIRVESGLGASGIPHIGSLGDAVRAYGVKLALENLGYKSELIAYSDDLDPLRKIPEGLFPDKEMEKKWKDEYLSKRVSAIPDPIDGCTHGSYGEHMSSLLLDGLKKLDIKYVHKTAHDTYKKGILKEQIHRILVDSKKIGDKIEELTGSDMFKNAVPYLPVCQECGKIYTTKSYEYIEDEKKVRYRCRDTERGGHDDKHILKGCGYDGESDVTKDFGKLAWKVEFAARWQAFDIRFEAYGKDIMDSVKVNDWISDEILGFPHPHHVQYEMFLDKGGKKISKSLGNVVTSEKWLNYGTPESILLLLYKRITGARELGFEDIPTLMDEYNELENIYFGKTKVDNEAKLVRSKGLYEYVNLLNPPKNSSTHVSYRLLIELCKIFKDHTVEHVVSKLIDYGTIKETSPHIEKLIGLAKQYSADFVETKIPATKITVDDSTKDALRQLTDILSKDEKIEDLQNSIYSIAKENQVQPKDFFRILYQIILSTDRGPKIGPFIEDIGKKKVAEDIKKYL